MRIFFIAALIFGAIELNAQPEPFAINWGTPDLSESGVDVVQLASGSIFYCGYAAQESGGTKVYLSKFSAEGVLMQEWLYGPSGHHVPYQMRIVNNQLVIAGRTENASGDINGLWIKVDTLGNLLNWSAWGEYDRSEGFTTFDVFNNGYFAVGGFAGSWNDVGNDALVAVFNQNFELMEINISSYPESDAINGLAVIDGNNFVITGDRDIEGHHVNLYVARFNEFCQEQWSYFEDNGYNGGSKSLMVNSQNEIIVIGESSGPGFDPFDATFARFTADGDIIVQTWIPGSEASDAIFSIIEPVAGSYLMCGYGFNEDTQSVDVVVYYTDNMGETVDQRFYNLDAGSDIAFKIVESVYGGFLVAGRSGSFDNGNLLIYDNIALVLDVEETAILDNLVCYPNPIAAQQALKANFEWSYADVYDVLGQKTTANKNRSLQFANPGQYFIRFYSESGNEIFTTRIICH